MGETEAATRKNSASEARNRSSRVISGQSRGEPEGPLGSLGSKSGERILFEGDRARVCGFLQAGFGLKHHLRRTSAGFDSLRIASGRDV